MMHLAYPNVDARASEYHVDTRLSEHRFWGCVRYLSLAQAPDDRYHAATANSPHREDVLAAVEGLVPEWLKGPQPSLQVFEIADVSMPSAGASLDLAYLLATIRRVRALRLEALRDAGDVWCTGQIKLPSSIKEPALGSVDSTGFAGKLRRFVNQQRDRLFFVPAANMVDTLCILCKDRHVEVLSLPTFHTRLEPARDKGSWPAPTVIVVGAGQLQGLVNILFEPPLLLTPPAFLPEALTLARFPDPQMRSPQVVVVPESRRGLSATQAVVGDAIQIVIQMRNAGQEMAVNLCFEEVLPPGLELIGGKARLNRENLEPSESRTISYTIKAQQVGEYVLPATAINYQDLHAREYHVVIRPERITVARNFRPTFVGRDKAFSVLQERFAAAAAGHGRVVLLAGEAGVGKSRLAQELCTWATAQGSLVLQGECRDKEALPPYLPFLKAFRGIGEFWPSLVSGGPLFREAIGPHGGVGESEWGRFSPQSEARAGPFQAIVECLLQAARTRKVVLFLDDMHWSDRESLALLLELGSQIQSAPILVIATYRSEELGEPLRDVIRKMKRYDLCEELHLPRLDLTDIRAVVASILGGPVDEHLFRHIYEESQGNPFFATEILKMLLANDSIRQVHGTWSAVTELATSEIPSKVYDVVLQRLEKLNSPHQRPRRSLLEFAAVVGDVFAVDKAFVTGCQRLMNLSVDEWALMDDLGSLEREFHIIHSRGLEFEFDHTKIREVLYKDLPPSLRLRCHRHIAQCIEERYLQKEAEEEDLFDLADHFYKGEAWEKAADYLIKAGQRAVEMSAYASAQHYFELAESALEWAKLSEEARQKLSVDLHYGLAAIAEVALQWDVHEHHLMSAQAIAAGLTDQQPHAKVLIGLAQLVTTRGDLERAASLTTQAKEIAIRFSLDKELASALMVLAWHHWQAERYGEALDGYREALQLFQRIGDRKGEADVLEEMGEVYGSLNNHPMALQLYQRVLPLYRELKDRRGEGRTLRYLGESYQAMGQWRLACEYYQKSLPIRREIGDVRGITVTLGALANVYMEMRRWTDALQCCEEALGISRRSRDTEMEIYRLQSIAEVYQKRYQIDQAIEIVQEALTIATEMGNVPPQCSAMQALGGLYRESGRQDEALAYLEQARAIAREAGAKNEEARSLSALGSFFQAISGFDKAIESYNQAVSIRRSLGDHKAVAEALNSLGEIYEKLSRYDEAMQHYQEGLGLRQEVQDRLGETRTLRKIANVHRIKGSYEAALRIYHETLTIDRELGNKTGEVNDLSGLGGVEQDRGNHQEALRYYQDRLAIEEEVGDLRSQADIHNQMADVFETLGELAQALAHHEQAAAIDRSVDDKRNLSVDLNKLGRIHRQLGNWGEALACDQEALQLQQEIGDRAGESLSLTGIAQTFAAMGEEQKASEYAEQALRIRGEEHDLLGQAQTLHTMAHASYRRNLFPKAVDYYQRALQLYSQLQNLEGEAHVRLGLGCCFNRIEEYHEARRHLERALQLFTDLRDPEGQTSALCTLADSWEGEDREKAIGYLQSALGLEEESRDKRGQSETRMRLGRLYIQGGNLTKAKQTLEGAVALATELADRECQSLCYGRLGDVYRRLEEFDAAKRAYEQAIALDRELGREEWLMIECKELADLLAAQEDTEGAAGCLEMALHNRSEATNPETLAHLHLTLGALRIRLGQLPTARESLREALTALERSTDRYTAPAAFLRLSRASFDLQEVTEAQSYAERSLRMAQAVENASVAVEALRQLARIHLFNGELEKAEAHLVEALSLHQKTDDVETETHIRTSLGNLYDRMGYLEQARLHLGKALELDRQLGQRQWEATDLMHLARTFTKDNPAQAEDYYTAALAIFESLGDSEGHGDALEALATLSEQSRDLGKARSYMTQAVELRHKHGDVHAEVVCRMLLAHLYLQDDLDEARVQYEEVVAISHRLGESRWEAVACANLGSTLRSMDKPERALGWAERAYAIFLELLDYDGLSQASYMIYDLSGRWRLVE